MSVFALLAIGAMLCFILGFVGLVLAAIFEPMWTALKKRLRR